MMKTSRSQCRRILLALGIMSSAMFANTTGVSQPVALAQATAAEPENAVALYHQGMKLRQDGKLAEAATTLRAAVRRDPSLTEAQIALAEVYLQQGEHNLAFAAIGNAMKAETRKEKADLTPFINLMGRVDMSQVDAKQAAAEAARVEAADLAAEKLPAEKLPAEKLPAEKLPAEKLPAEKPAPSGQWKVDDAVEVEWTGRWYSAKILEVKDGTFKIRYDGYSENWDEWVTPARIRRRSAVQTATPADVQSPTPQKSGTETSQNHAEPRLGKYTLFAYGSPFNPPINIGHFVLMPGGRYRASNTAKEEYFGEGKYSFDGKAGAITWVDGPYKNNNWTGKFTTGNQGKDHKIAVTRTTVGINQLK